MEDQVTDIRTQAYLTFMLDQEIFCVSVNAVVKILEVPNITRVPESPAFMKGIINLRGNILPVVDTRLKLGLEEADHSPKTRILVLDINSANKILSIGAIVDLAKEVISVNTEEIQPPPSLEDYERAPYIEGVINHEEKFILILNINKLFAKNEIEELDNLKN
ncbi:MAG: chemotaxis protein CheW [Cytophagales bacterium]|nr:chemotaxis protein CheW [Cytophagales bacterium]